MASAAVRGGAWGRLVREPPRGLPAVLLLNRRHSLHLTPQQSTSIPRIRETAHTANKRLVFELMIRLSPELWDVPQKPQSRKDMV